MARYGDDTLLVCESCGGRVTGRYRASFVNTRIQHTSSDSRVARVASSPAYWLRNMPLRCPSCGATENIFLRNDTTAWIMFLRQQLRVLCRITHAMRWDSFGTLEDASDGFLADALGGRSSLFPEEADGFGADNWSLAHPDLLPAGANYEMYERLVDQLLVATGDAAELSPSRPAASASFVAKLPRTVLSTILVNEFHKRGFDSVCAICQDEWEIGTSMVCRLPCAHWFDSHCIERWLGARNTCPICRSEMPTDDPSYEKRKRELAEARHAAELSAHGSLSQRESIAKTSLVQFISQERSTVLGAVSPFNALSTLFAIDCSGRVTDMETCAGLRSDDDGELLLALRFTRPVSLHSIKLRALDSTPDFVPPYEMDLFANEQLDWTDVNAVVTPSQTVRLQAQQLRIGGERCILRAAFFRRITTLTIVFRSNGPLHLSDLELFGDCLDASTAANLA